MQNPPLASKVKECCKIPEIIPQDFFDKCDAAHPNPPKMAGPPKGKFILEDQNHQANLKLTFTTKNRLLHERMHNERNQNHG